MLIRNRNALHPMPSSTFPINDPLTPQTPHRGRQTRDLLLYTTHPYSQLFIAAPHSMKAERNL